MTPAAIPELDTKKTVQAQTILARSCVLVLKCGYVSNRKNVDARSLKMEKDGESLEDEKRVLSISKRLVDPEDLRPCERTIGAAKQLLRARAVPGSRVFGDRTYIVPLLGVVEVEKRLLELSADLDRFKTDLAARWADVVERAKSKHGKLFNASEFPTADDVLSEYQLDWSYVSFQAPENLESVSMALAESTNAKYQAQMADAYNEVLVSLRQAALTVMQELAARLKPDQNGKPKTLKATALRDIQELLGQLPILNMTDDDRLAQTMARVGVVVEGVTVDTLRNAPAVRDMLLVTAQTACEQLEALVLDGERGIDFSLGKRKAS